MCFLTGCHSKQEKQLQTQQSGLIEQQTKASQFGLKNLEGSLPDVLKYFKSLLSGDRAAIEGAIAPAVSTLTSEYESAAKASSEFAPRGGGRTAALEEAPYKEAGDISKLVETAQAEGATGMMSVDQLLASLSMGSGSIASSTVADAQLTEQQHIAQQQQQQQQAGQSVGALLALLAL